MDLSEPKTSLHDILNDPTIPIWKKDLIVRKRNTNRLLFGNLKYTCSLSVEHPTTSTNKLISNGDEFSGSKQDITSSAAVADVVECSGGNTVVITAESNGRDLVGESSSSSSDQDESVNQCVSEHHQQEMIIETNSSVKQKIKLKKMQCITETKQRKFSVPSLNASPKEISLLDAEEIKYGPGIVHKLRDRYINITLREAANSYSRPPLSNLRRASSLDDILDESRDVSQQPKYIKKSGANKKINNLNKQESLKRVRSMEVLNFDAKPPLVNEDIVIIEQSKPVSPIVRKRTPSGSQIENEMPPTEIVKQTLRKFEKRTNPSPVKPNFNKKPSLSPKPKSPPIRRITPPSVSNRNGDLSPKINNKKPNFIPKNGEDGPKVTSPKLVHEKSKISSPILKDQPKISSPILKEQPKISSPIIKEQPTIFSPVNKEQPNISSPIIKEEPKIPSPSVKIATEQPKISSLPPKEPKILSPIVKEPPKSPTAIERPKISNAIPDEHTRVEQPKVLTPSKEQQTSPVPKERKTSIEQNTKVLQNEESSTVKPISATALENIRKNGYSFEIKTSTNNLSHLPNSKLENKNDSPKQVGVIRPIVTKTVDEKNLINRAPANFAKPPTTNSAPILQVKPTSELWSNKKRHFNNQGSTQTFDFTARKTVPDYIENDGIVRTSSVSDDISDGPLSPLLKDVEVIGGNVLINGRSNIQKIPKTNKLRIKFDDAMTSTFEYPSEASLLEDAPATPSAGDAGRSTLQPLPSGSGTLASYTPSKMLMSEDTFELGVTRAAAATTPVLYLDSTTEESSDDCLLKPADDTETVTWSSETASDLLF